MRRGLKVIGWVFAFSACFGVGAVIAAHSDPFPPGVTDPGATVVPTSPASPESETLTGKLDLQTAHNLYVGGACRTNWHGTLTLQLGQTGSVSGTGVFRLAGELHCDFSVVQVQTKTVNVGVEGSMAGKKLTLSITQGNLEPKASDDFGGLTHTVRFLGLSAPLGGQQQVHASRSDGDRGSYTAAGTFTVSCTSGCP